MSAFLSKLSAHREYSGGCFFLNEEIAALIKPLLGLELEKARMFLGKVEMRLRYLLCHFHWT